MDSKKFVEGKCPECNKKAKTDPMPVGPKQINVLKYRVHCKDCGKNDVRTTSRGNLLSISPRKL